MADIENYSASSGRIIDEDGTTKNVVDLLGGGEAVGEKVYDIEQYAARSGRVIGEDGKAYNLVELLGGESHDLSEIIALLTYKYNAIANGNECICSMLGTSDRLSSAMCEGVVSYINLAEEA